MSESVNPTPRPDEEYFKVKSSNEDSLKKDMSTTMLLFLVLYYSKEAFSIGHDRMAIDTKGAELSNQKIDSYIREEANIPFSTLPQSELNKKKPDQGVLEDMMAKNQLANAQFSIKGDEVNGERQTLSTFANSIGSTTSQVQQTSEQYTAALKLIETITTVIVR